jgi:hypothetical protein
MLIERRVTNMNRVIPGVAVVLASSWAVTALAADPVPSTAAPVAATTAATSTSPAAGKVEQTSASTSSSSNASVQRLVCLNMTLQCFAIKPPPDNAQGKEQTATLDLKAPDIRRVVPAIQLHAPEEPVDIEEQQVQVEGTRPEVYVPGGIASLPWAVMHPTQAWRILMPVPPGTAK